MKPKIFCRCSSFPS